MVGINLGAKAPRRTKSADRLDGNVRDVVIALCEDLDTPRALSVVIMLRYHEYRELLKLSCDPKEYADDVSYLRAAAATDLLRKYEAIPAFTEGEKKAEAVRAFYKAENHCHNTNLRVKDFTENCRATGIDYPPETDQVIGAMRAFCSGVLGSLPVDLDVKLGPGATVSDKAHLATVPDKFSSTPTMTSMVSCLLPYWDETAWAQAHYRRQHARTHEPIRTVKGNQFFTVPKNAKTHRGAAKAPSINVSFQLAVGREVRQRLGRIGIDLQVGQEKHQRLAREGSVDEHLVTLDLEQASDTVAKETVKLCLPTLWYELLYTLREPLTQVDGKWVFLEKFSAMGNGFTFELETLIFLAVIAGVCALTGDDIWSLIANGEVSVYGDDIIVPKRMSRDCIALLRFFGFKLNGTKSHVSGNFRESCGGDYFNGSEVTTLKLEDEITEPHQWISFANGLARLGSCLGGLGLSARIVERARLRAISNLPIHIRSLTGPIDLGDAVIHAPFDDWSRRLEDRKGRVWLTGWYAVSPKVTWEHFYPDVQLASALYGSDSLGVTQRNTAGYRIKRVGRPRFAWSGSQPKTLRFLRAIERVTGVEGKTLHAQSSVTFGGPTFVGPLRRSGGVGTPFR